MGYTTIRISTEQKEEFNKRKITQLETYEEIINRLFLDSEELKKLKKELSM